MNDTSEFLELCVASYRSERDEVERLTRRYLWDAVLLRGWPFFETSRQRRRLWNSVRLRDSDQAYCIAVFFGTPYFLARR